MPTLRIYRPEEEIRKPFFRVNMDGCKIRMASTGYPEFHIPEHPYANQNGWILAHRIVAEQFLGRYLTPCETIHHIDRDRANFSLENLWLFPDNTTHLRVAHAPSQNKELVREVLAAAKDPNVTLESLSCASQTARKILKHHNVQWLDADKTHLEEKEVAEALEKSSMNVERAAKLLGVSHGTLRRNFPHLLKSSRNPIGFLEKHREELSQDYANGVRWSELCEKYSTNKKTILDHLLKWGVQMNRRA